MKKSDVCVDLPNNEWYGINIDKVMVCSAYISTAATWADVLPCYGRLYRPQNLTQLLLYAMSSYRTERYKIDCCQHHECYVDEQLDLFG